MRLQNNVVNCSASEFQSTHPHGVRLCAPTLIRLDSVFQSTHPHGVRLFLLIRYIIFGAFQSTHPHGVRLWNREIRRISFEFQSTHPHGVRLDFLTLNNCSYVVSIHAPTWGATKVLFSSWTICCFNPRTHMGCDHTSGSLLCRDLSFNPRTHMGCDYCPFCGKKYVEEFQSTHPHGVRHPRARSNLAILAVSIHAPTWGATQLINLGRGETKVSIHAPTWGATPC